MSSTVEQPLFRRAAITVIAAIVVSGLYFGRELLIPFTLAVFLSFLLSPAVRALERLPMGRIVAVLLVVSASFGAIGAVGWVVATQASALVHELPQYRDNIRAKVQQFRGEMSSRFRRASEMADGIQSEVNRIPPPPPSPSTELGSPVEAILGPAMPPAAEPEAEKPVKVEVVGQDGLVTTIVGWASPVVDPLATLGIAALFLFFFLIFREDLRDRLVHAAGPTHIHMTTATLTDSAARVARYFAALALANLIIGAAIGVGFYFIGVPKAILWGLLAAVLRFVPYIGALIAAIFPATLAAAIFDGWMQAALVVGWTIVADVSAANFLEPWLLGSRVGASPAAIVVSFVFWSWLWGGIGFLLATPITVCLIVLGKHVPGFEPFYVLLGNEPVLEPKLRLYQRMLSSDRTEAVAVVKRYAETNSPLDVFDTLVLPALAQLQHDQNLGLLDAKRVEAAKTIVTELVEWSKTSRPHDDDGFLTSQPVRAPLLVLPDRGLFDEFVPAILAEVGRAPTDHWQVVLPTVLASEVVDRARDVDAAGILIVAVEPRSLDRIIHLYRRLSMAPSDGDFHVGLFSESQRGLLFRKRLRKLDRVRVYNNLHDLLLAVSAGAPPVVAARPSAPRHARVTAHVKDAVLR